MKDRNDDPKTQQTTATTERCDTTQQEPPQKGGGGNNKKGLLELLIFTLALVTGTASSILSKIMYNTHDQQGRHFDKPLAQTLAMFVAMLFGLPIHYLIVKWKIPFPGYHGWSAAAAADGEEVAIPLKQDKHRTSPATVIDIDRTPRMHSHKWEAIKAARSTEREEKQNLLPAHSSSLYPSYVFADGDNNDDDTSITTTTAPMTTMTRIPLETYFQLFIPAFFDCTSTALFMVGLLFLDVSIYQLLRGSGIIFVALLREYGLKEHLYHYQWVGLGWNVVSALLVGATALLDSSSSSSSGTSNSDDAAAADTNAASVQAALWGVTMMMAGTLLQAMEFVLEEKFMVADDVKVPPLLFFGMKGFWGVLLTLLVLYPIGYYSPGTDDGSLENVWTSWEIFSATRSIQVLVLVYCVVIFGFNLFCVLVTFLLSSVWHAILDNFRPLTVWGTDLILYYYYYYYTTTAARNDDNGHHLGEAWTPYSWLQLAGMAVLLYGTAIYNAPDSGSIKLQGEWYSLGMDYTEEYEQILNSRLLEQEELADEEAAKEKEASHDQQHQKKRTASSSSRGRHPFARGSYPSLQGFLTVSVGNHVSRSNSSIRFGRRAATYQPLGSPKLYHHEDPHHHRGGGRGRHGADAGGMDDRRTPQNVYRNNNRSFDSLDDEQNTV